MMSELTDTFGCVQKDTLINLPDSKLSIEKIWDDYHTTISFDKKFPGVEFTIPKSDIRVLSFDGTNFIYQQIKRIVKHKVFNCTTDVYLQNGYKLSILEPCKLLTEDGLLFKIRRGFNIATPRDFDNISKSFCITKSGNIMFIKVIKIDYVTINDTCYSLEFDEHHNFIGNSMVCGDFIENNS